jgi:transposase InsO family protein
MPCWSSSQGVSSYYGFPTQQRLNYPTSRWPSSRTREEVKWAILNWVDWFNNRRLLEPIGNIPPAEAEANYYTQIPESAMSA